MCVEGFRDSYGWPLRKSGPSLAHQVRGDLGKTVMVKRIGGGTRRPQGRAKKVSGGWGSVLGRDCGQVRVSVDG